MSMEDGSEQQMKMSSNDFLKVSQTISDMAAKYAKLEVRYDDAMDKIGTLEEENQELKNIVDEKEAVIDELKKVIEEKDAQLAETQSIQIPTQEQLQQAINILLQENLILSLIKTRQFMDEKVPDLGTASLLRAFVTDCLPDSLKASLTALVNSLMALPNKPKPQPPLINDHRTFNATGDVVIEKHVDYEVGHVETGGTGIGINKETQE